MRINKIKELHEIEIEIKSLEIKIIIERIKDKLEEKKCQKKKQTIKWKH